MLKFLMEMTIEDIIKNIIDILIVSYIIYQIIQLVRGTRAIQLLKGIFVLLIMLMLSGWFKLETMLWLSNQIFTFGVFATLIIFQPELRRALEQIGRGKLFNRMSIADQLVNHKISEVIKATNYLAKRKIGALIVFEKDTGLNEYLESGTSLEAQISSELLINIFIPNTPLHDGAVIIRGAQILAAGCYLPLSENPFISKELGTRHRAAIGVSENCDAISIVVSEETGQVSLAQMGQVVRDIKEESLISKLHDELNPNAADTKSEKSSFWKRKGD